MQQPRCEWEMLVFGGFSHVSALPELICCNCGVAIRIEVRLKIEGRGNSSSEECSLHLAENQADEP